MVGLVPRNLLMFGAWVRILARSRERGVCLPINWVCPINVEGDYFVCTYATNSISRPNEGKGRRNPSRFKN